MPSALKSSIDLTPTVGVLLALVVYMMVVAPSSESASRLDQPPVHMPPGDMSTSPPPWHVSLRTDGSLWIAQGEGQPRPATPTQVLQEVPPEAQIYLMADADADYGPFAEFASFLDANGRAIAIVNEDLT